MAGDNKPVRYSEAMDSVAFNTMKSGHTAQELAQILGISEKTLYLWREKHPSFLQSIEEGREVHDTRRVENALLASAVGGGKIKKEKIVVTDGVAEKHVVEEELPANVTAQKFWLMNRNPKRWREKQEIEHSGGISLAGLVAEAANTQDDDD